MTTISKPIPGTYPEYFETYIKLVPEGNIFEELTASYIETMELLTSLDLETLHFRYAPGKWNILEVMQHVMDSERIFTYRALCIARGEQNPLPGFDENMYAQNSQASQRNIDDMMREFSLLRACSIELFKSLTPEQLQLTGIANNKTVSVNALAFILLGHEIHHRLIIEQRYLNA
jgi:uncharacterized damage-inducible protein DinB